MAREMVIDVTILNGRRRQLTPVVGWAKGRWLQCARKRHPSLSPAAPKRRGGIAGGSLQAQDRPNKPSRATLDQPHLQAANLVPLGGMVDGETPFSAQAFATSFRFRAEHMPATRVCRPGAGVVRDSPLSSRGLKQHGLPLLAAVGSGPGVKVALPLELSRAAILSSPQSSP
jgi:hypothetical protein